MSDKTFKRPDTFKRPEEDTPFRRETPAGVEDVPAWQQLEPGRYQPRRFRGSFPGRDLG